MAKDIIDLIGTHSGDWCVMDFDLKDYHAKRIDPLATRIAAIEAATGTGSHMQVVVKSGVFPPDAEPSEDTKALLWAYKELPTEEVPTPPEPTDWKLLVFLYEIKGDTGAQGAQGDKGDKGDTGSGMALRGVVNTVTDLYTEVNVREGYCYLVLDTEKVYVFIGTLAAHISDPTKWKDLGHLTGVKGDKGDKGDKGEQGIQGERGKAGGISSFLLSWIVSTATSSAISGVMMEVNTTINDAINDMAMELGNLAEDAAQSAIDKAMDEMMDQFKGDKGEKGDKGDKGDDGKDGKSFQVVGSYSSLTAFRVSYPLITANVGKAAIIRSVPPKEDDGLWAITESVIGTVQNEYFGQLTGQKGDKGEDADWTIQLRDEHNVATGSPVVIEPTTEGVPNFYIQGTKGVYVERFMDTNAGFAIKLRLPVPHVSDGTDGFPNTTGKFLTNNGTKLQWQDMEVDSSPASEVRLQSPDGTVWSITVGNDGRLDVEEVIV